MAEKITKENYKEQIKLFQPKLPRFMNGIKAFFIGGIICLGGQVVHNIYQDFFQLSEIHASYFTIITFIVITTLLTGLGIFDKIGQFAGAGTLILVTGFANAIVSAALEHKSEGPVLGIANNMFKIAGSVLVYGVVAATIVGIISMAVNHF
ncbi:stage V sporulation protein AC [Calidifontibacillus erzurumensis]|uniref:stage V sporulation protein AC n=1 Tax=Calidifontibacillus erzurumensis TaxID=2741433 RepID=UPI0035B563A0